LSLNNIKRLSIKDDACMTVVILYTALCTKMHL